MTIQELKELLESKNFHHATYRDIGTLWEGLWIYRKNQDGFQNFEPVGAFSKNSPFLDEAYKLLRNTGISVGRYGAG